ncbi:aromatic acid exporter family protein [Dehalobacter sp. DCM]|uniref:FUSC family protein n=1 Tax=Dehalobacter sp. DCM TaxID=2907827 RepID=UPI0030813B44|nr:aromatic acid exporter family protein [Dehalobacter sp. DCM]
MNIGARTLKTALAVAISVYLCELLHIGPALFAATSAVVCMQKSLGRSFKTALEEITVNVIAIAVAVTLGLLIPIQFLSMALATIILIVFFTKVIKVPNQIVLAVISAIFILASPQDEFLTQATSRSLALLIGLITANVINLTIAPPSYHRSLQAKLIELNNFSAQMLIDAVNRYHYINTITDEEKGKNKAELIMLYQEADSLYDLVRQEWNVTWFGIRKSTGKGHISNDFYKEYKNYCQGIWQRSQDLIFLAEERKARREKANAQTVSPEFDRIFEMLHHVIFSATSYNQQLQLKIKGEKTAPLPELHVWSKLHEIINEWQESKPDNSFYAHALTELSVVTYSIRWFAKESSRLLNME